MSDIAWPSPPWKKPGRRPSGGLGRRFAYASAILSAVSIFVIGTGAWWFTRHQFVEKFEFTLRADAALYAGHVDGLLTAVTTTMASLAHNTVLATALIDSSGRETYLIPFLSGFKAVNGVPVDITFTDFEGKVIATNGHKGATAAEAAWLATAIATGSPRATILSTPDGDAIIGAELLIYPRTATPEGALLYRIPVRALQRHPNARVVYQTAEGEKATPEFSWPERDSDGDPTALATHPVRIPPGLQPLDLRVEVMAQKDLLYPSLRSAAFTYALASLATMAVVLLLGQQVSRRLTRSLRELEELASAMISEGFSHRRVSIPNDGGPDDGGDEVARLSRAINYMLDRLGEAYAELGRKAGEELAGQRELFELAVRGTNDGIWDWNLDTGRIWFSGRWKAMLGYAEDELPNDRATWAQILPDGECQRLFALIGDYNEGRVAEFETILVCRHKDGTPRYVLSRAIHKKDARGAVVRIVGAHTDVTRNHLREEELRASRARLAYAQRVACLGNWDYDVASNTMEWSDEVFCIFDLDPADGITVERFFLRVHPDDRQQVRRIIDSAAQRPRDQPHPKVVFEYRILLTGERIRHLLAVFGDVIPGASGALSKITGTIQDITERKEVETALAEKTAALERSNAELEMFAYVASHDLRQPLRMVTSYLTLLERQYAGKLDGDARDFIGFARDGARRMDHLIVDLLEYSRIGRGERRMEPVSLKAVVDGVLATLGVAAQESNATITLAESWPTVSGSEMELARLFQNLIANALKYRAPSRPPVLHLDVRRDSHEWVVSLQDNGIGMAPEHFERIFRIFQRLHAANEFEGTGIGLAICKKIVERHGGRIWVASTPDIGSTFLFSLPFPPLPASPTLDSTSRSPTSRSLP